MSSKPTAYPFHQVDVFTDTAYFGNPVAVVNCLDTSLPLPSQEQMQRFARWTNLSETTFLLPPSRGAEADYRLKIFTPVEELPFAGHPTLGSCYSFLRHLGDERCSSLLKSRGGKLVQECAIGMVPLQVSPDASEVRFLAPEFVRYEPVDAATVERITRALCLDPADILDAQHIDNGPHWIGIKLPSAQHVLDINPTNPGCDVASVRDLFFGFIGPYPDGVNADGEKLANEVRAFVFADIGEDPVTGSLNAGFAKWLEATGDSPATEYVNSQGTAIGRKGRISVKINRTPSSDKSEIWIGGSCTVCIDGQVHI
ncbi:phenazine biosynthesis protein PhzF family [Moesziomyces antarcticus]|uniref:Related to antibiotic biosynthesis protein n=1 Tax=Pseudozyma antarctica TaxID=84753 RepID=A0A5C3FLI5_PSEA2|nr:phenazine biosynthesis protein PhzF family [Moesziomyces antarcticus]GAK63712.1 phenazine biosynthesis protein PhzF family [Moesziomyces antarcticus]SPO44309.1 related to antibiotic biosynthesis protein [Moesziomyces antarcticus]